MAVCIFNTAFSFTPPADTTRDKYIEEYPERFYIRPVFTLRNLTLELGSRSNKTKISYRPNGNGYLGVGLYIFDIGIGASFKLPENEKSNSRFGKTDFLDLQSNIYGKKWGADLSLQKYEGFYVNNPALHFSEWQKNDPYPQRNDLAVTKLSANIFYIENHKKFSYRSAYNQADRQRKSGGSFYFGTKFLYQDISADTSLIPFNSRQYLDLEDLKRVNFYSLGILPGYTHTFIYQYFYFNFSLAVGPAYQLSSYNENNQRLKDRQLTYAINGRAALGYNSPRWFAGITFVSHSSNLKTEHVQISGETGNTRIFFGYRFKEVGILKKKLL